MRKSSVDELHCVAYLHTATAEEKAEKACSLPNRHNMPLSCFENANAKRETTKCDKISETVGKEICYWKRTTYATASAQVWLYAGVRYRLSWITWRRHIFRVVP